MIFPAESTSISSALTIVDSLWAITRVVRFLATSSRAAWISRSVLISSADVASSSTSILGFFSTVRAIATRCFSPPDSFSPLSPTRVSYPCGREVIKSWMLASFAAFATSSSVACGLPYRMLYRMVSLNRTVSWGTIPIVFLRLAWVT